MATITASHFISSVSCLSSSEVNATSKIVGQNQMSMLSQKYGVRSMNMVDRLQMKKRSAFVWRSLCVKSNATEIAPGQQEEEEVQGNGMTIVFVSTEVAPWSKTGGLGDVVGGLPPALAARGHRVMSISPRYDQYKDAWDTSVTVEIPVGDGVETVRFFHCYKRGVDRVFVDHPSFLEKVWGKTASKIYGPATSVDYSDNQLRFSLLCLAALEAPRVLNLQGSKTFSGPYGEDVVFVANDWHTALLPCYLKSVYQPKGLYKSAKVAFVIHNISYQGRFAFEDYSRLNLPAQLKSSFDFIDGYKKPVKGRKINWMKAAILEADRVLTVSPHYAEEVVSGEAKGVELDSFIRSVGITGIVNGMDVQEWNPAMDKFIGIKYDKKTVLSAKPLVKEALQAELGFPVDKDIPLIGFIGRLEEQKGSDILAAAIPMLAKNDVQIVVLGTGKKYMEKQIAKMEMMFPDKVRGVAKFNVSLAHMITAGSDFMIIPSRFEPCGLIQLHAMRYGTVCIVASTGGLVDTVKEGYTGFHMGAFNVECDEVDEEDVNAIVKTVVRALAVYGTSAFTKMIHNCMAQDFSWKAPARLWEKVLLSLGVDGGEAGSEGVEVTPLARENVATP